MTRCMLAVRRRMYSLIGKKRILTEVGLKLNQVRQQLVLVVTSVLHAGVVSM